MINDDAKASLKIPKISITAKAKSESKVVNTKYITTAPRILCPEKSCPSAMEAYSIRMFDKTSIIRLSTKNRIRMEKLPEYSFNPNMSRNSARFS